MALCFFTVGDNGTDDKNDRIQSDRFEEIYNRYKRIMFQVAYNVLRDFHDAEDAVHNAFVSVSKNIGRIYRLPDGELTPYLCRAAHNSAVNILVKKKRITDNEQPYPENADEPGGEDGVLERMCARENAETVAECIELLPDIYRDVLTMHYVEEMSAAKIAKTFSLEKSTVKKRLVRGKKLLISLLAERGMEK